MQSSVLRGTLILLASGLLNRILGFVYRIFLSRYLGPQGMGILSMAFPVLGITLTLTTLSVPVALSKIVAERAARGGGVRQALVLALVLVGGMSALGALGLWLLLPVISRHFLTDPRSRGPLLLFLPLIPVVGIGSVLRGYYQGLSRMTPGAAGQLVETLVRIAAVVLVLPLFVGRGLGALAQGAALGVLLGEAAGLLVLLLPVWGRAPVPTERLPRSIAGTLRELLAQSLPLTFTRLVAAGTDMADATLIPRRLMMAGFSLDAATAFYGSLSGMAFPLLFFPTVLTFALSGSLVPAISEAAARGDDRSVRRRTEKALHATFLVSLPAATLFMVLGEPLAHLIYGHEQVGRLLLPLAFAAPFLYLENTVSAVLRGLGRPATSMLNGLVGSVVRLFMVYYLTPLPFIGAKAILFGFFMDLFLSFLLNFLALARLVSVGLDLANWVLKPTAACLVMAFLLLRVAALTAGLGSLPSIVLALLAGTAGYLATLIALRGLIRPSAVA